MSIRNDDQGHGHPHSGNERRTRQRATDQEIQNWISRQHGFVPESAWIAHCKELFGLAAPGTSHNENPCPPQRSQRLSKRSDASDCFKRLAEERRFAPPPFHATYLRTSNRNSIRRLPEPRFCGTCSVESRFSAFLNGARLLAGNERPCNLVRDTGLRVWKYGHLAASVGIQQPVGVCDVVEREATGDFADDRRAFRGECQGIRNQTSKL